MERYEDPTWQASMRIHFDYNNMMAAQLGPTAGIAREQVSSLAERAAHAHAALQGMRRAGKLEWAELPYRQQMVREVAAYAGAARDRFESFVVLGIGGSALGNIALHLALNHPFYNLLPSHQRGPRMFFLDNVDPDLNAGLLDVVDPTRTLFNVITKSGSTAETMCQFLIFKEELERRLGAGYREHIVATTDPRSGLLRQIAQAEGYRTFDVPPGVGGRFSVLSPVGLLSAAVSGVDVAELLAGAASSDRRCQEPDVWRNPAYMNALLQYIANTEQGRHIVVVMPYAQALLGVADWFRQLWAESLGKRYRRDGREVRVGPTPVKALGTTDQHSQMQLYAEGPRDKVVNFVAVERWQRQVDIPSTAMEGLAYLGGHTLSELMQAERLATALALTKSGQSNCTLTLPEINPFTVGQLLFLLEIQTAYSGELYNVNAFDQPGVEEGKIATYALLGRQGYEQQRAGIAAREGQRNEAFVI